MESLHTCPLGWVHHLSLLACPTGLARYCRNQHNV